MIDLRLPTQLYVTRKKKPPTHDEFIPVRNSDGRQLFVKPKGGMWTSSWDATERTSAWVEWCRMEGQEEWVKGKWWLLAPAPDARVAIIHSLPDLKRLLKHYPYHYPLMEHMPYLIGQCLDYEAMAQDYDAIHLTEKGQWRTRLTAPNLYGWDCECTLWLRWKFAAVVPTDNQQQP
jgi:hypothetical protein